jgi:serine/threonine protein kinase
LTTPQQIQDCLEIQRQEERAGRTPPRLGEILVQKKLLTPEQVSQALSDQQTEVRYCARCRIRVNVSLRQDAVWYRCARCQGPLVAPESATQIDVVDDAAIVVSRDPIPAEVQQAAQNPDCRFGKYLILRELGSGGVGRVDLAWDSYLSQYVALKRLRPRLHGETPEMAESWTYSLITEARHAIRLRHPGIVTVFDVGRIHKEFYIAMEYLEGETLYARLCASREAAQLSPFYEHPKQVLRLLVEVARAVHYAHTRPSPVIHCDLKPSNIIIGRDGRARVFDFGLARNVHPDREEDGEVSGTPSYMAPEQAAGRTADIDARTDVWALGAILYELLSGQPPFVGQTFEILHRTMTERPKPINDTIRDTTRRMQAGEISTKALVRVPSFLEELCMKCLSLDKAERPGSMAVVADLIEGGMVPGAEARPAPAPAPAPDPRPAPVVAAAAAPPTAPPKTPSWRLWSGAAALLLAATVAAFALRGRAASEGGESGIARDVASFRLAEALTAAESTPLAPEVQAVIRLRDRVAGRIASVPASLSELRLRERTLRSVRLESADRSFLKVAKGDVRMTVAWADLEPSQFISLADDGRSGLDDVDRLALGVYCWSVGRNGEAREYLGLLRGTDLDPQADRILRRMDAK